MEKDLNQKLNGALDVKLTEIEKSFHRAEILKFIEREKPVNKNPASPFYTRIFLKNHFALATSALVVFLITGMSVSAESALPDSHFFYRIKTKITEPALLFFAPTDKIKADIKVSLVEKRLNELSRLALAPKKFKQENKVVFSNQFSIQVKSAQKAISELTSENENPAYALKKANDLQSILSGENAILKGVSEKKDDFKEYYKKELNGKINDNIESTAVIEEQITKELEEKNDDLDKALALQKESITASIKKINEGRNIRFKDGEKPDSTAVQEWTESEIVEMSLLLDEVDKKVEEINKKDALKIYSRIDQRLGKIELLIKNENDDVSEVKPD